MIQHKDHFHGSDLEKIEAIYGIKKEEIISFSANVNPLGISPLLRESLSAHLDAITTYPDREYKELRECIAAYAGTEADNILVGNGSTELISLFIQITHPAKALILGPTYSEYEREITLEGGKTHYYPLKEENDFSLDVADFTSKLTDDIDLVVLCNPNNPTSTCISQKEMRQILDVCTEGNIYVMVDETYIEFVDDINVMSAVPLTAYYNNIIILRGTSKFFAAPGLRLGYAITGNKDLLQQINQFKNPWMINSLAEVAGKLMFTDKKYIEATRTLIAMERRRCYSILESALGYKPYKANANFMLVKITDPAVTSSMLFERCIKEKMMIRDCSTFPFLDESYIRFCFMGKDADDRLLECLMK